MKRFSKDNRGFSLTELIIVIAIIALLAAVVPPLLIKYIDNSKESRAINSCSNIYTAARDEIMSNPAIKGNVSSDQSAWPAILEKAGKADETDIRIVDIKQSPTEEITKITIYDRGIYVTFDAMSNAYVSSKTSPFITDDGHLTASNSNGDEIPLTDAPSGFLHMPEPPANSTPEEAPIIPATPDGSNPMYFVSTSNEQIKTGIQSVVTRFDNSFVQPYKNSAAELKFGYNNNKGVYLIQATTYKKDTGFTTTNIKKSTNVDFVDILTSTFVGTDYDVKGAMLYYDRSGNLMTNFGTGNQEEVTKENKNTYLELQDKQTGEITTYYYDANTGWYVK